jgi:hypothetical protein
MNSPSRHSTTVRHRRYPPGSTAPKIHDELKPPAEHAQDSTIEKPLPDRWTMLEERLTAVERAHADLSDQVRNLR